MSSIGKEVEKFIEPYIGKTVSRVWQGHGSAIFLEIGELTKCKGELTIMIEWSWRVEKENQIYFGSWSSEGDFPLLQKLLGLKVLGISFQSRLPEVVVMLSKNYWVNSYSTVEGNPEWALITPEKTLLSKNGNLIFE